MCTGELVLETRPGFVGSATGATPGTPVDTDVVPEPPETWGPLAPPWPADGLAPGSDVALPESCAFVPLGAVAPASACVHSYENCVPAFFFAAAPFEDDLLAAASRCPRAEDECAWCAAGEPATAAVER
jgi:hypothetical protein